MAKTTHQTAQDLRPDEVVYRFRVHPDRCYEYVSPSIERILGLTPDDVLGTHLERLLVPADRERLHALLETSGSSSAHSEVFNCSLINRDGRALRCGKEQSGAQGAGGDEHEPHG